MQKNEYDKISYKSNLCSKFLRWKCAVNIRSEINSPKFRNRIATILNMNVYLEYQYERAVRLLNRRAQRVQRSRRWPEGSAWRTWTSTSSSRPSPRTSKSLSTFFSSDSRLPSVSLSASLPLYRSLSLLTPQSFHPFIASSVHNFILFKHILYAIIIFIVCLPCNNYFHFLKINLISKRFVDTSTKIDFRKRFNARKHLFCSWIRFLKLIYWNQEF